MLRNKNHVKNLGEIAAKVVAVLEEHSDYVQSVHEEMRAFGAPSECAELAFDGLAESIEQDAMKVCHSYGISFRTFKEEVDARTGGRWSYFNVFIHLT